MKKSNSKIRHKRLDELEVAVTKTDFYLGLKNKEILNHYIRTPVTIIQLLLDQDELSPQDKELAKSELTTIVETVRMVIDGSYDLDDYDLRHNNDYDYS